jgi:hypothetical protein
MENIAHCLRKTHNRGTRALLLFSNAHECMNEKWISPWKRGCLVHRESAICIFTAFVKQGVQRF